MKWRTGGAWVAAVALSVLGPSAALAAPGVVTTLDFTHDPSHTLGTGPFGVVEVTELTDGYRYDATLFGNLRFTDTAAFDAFAFNFFTGDADAIITQLTPGFARLPFNPSQPFYPEGSFGNWQWAIGCNCPQGLGQTLSFEVRRIDGLLPLVGRSFSGDWAVAGVVDSQTGATTAIGATFRSTTPEPAAWAMMILGFGAVGLALRRSRRPDSAGSLAA